MNQNPAASAKIALAVNCAFAQEMSDRWGTLLPNFTQLQTLHRVMHAEFMPNAGEVVGNDQEARDDYALLEAQTRELLSGAETPQDKVNAMAFYQARFQQIAPFGLGSAMVGVVVMGTQMKNLINAPRNYMEQIYAHASDWRRSLTAARLENNIGPLAGIIGSVGEVQMPVTGSDAHHAAPFAIRKADQPGPGTVEERLEQSRLAPAVDHSISL